MKERPVSAETIGRLADQGQDISSFFTNDGKMMPSLGNGGIDSNGDAPDELNEAAREK